MTDPYYKNTIENLKKKSKNTIEILNTKIIWIKSLDYS